MDPNNLNANPIPQDPKVILNTIQNTNQAPENNTKLNESSKRKSKIIKLLTIFVILFLVIAIGIYLVISNKTNFLNLSKDSKFINSGKEVIKNVTFEKIPTPSLSKEIVNNTILYKNNYEPKISFNYPADDKWEVKDYYYNKPNISHIPGMISVIAVVDKECKDMCEEVFAIGIFEKGSKADPGIDSKEKAMAQNPSYILVSKQNVTLDNLNGTRLEYMRKGSKNGNSIDYIFTNEKYAFYIGVNMNAGAIGRMNYQEIGENIAKSIKFSQ